MVDKFPRKSLFLFTLSNSLSDNDRANFGIGKLYLNSELYEKAEAKFRSIKNPVLSGEALYYYLKMGEAAKATYLVDKKTATNDNLYYHLIYSAYSDINPSKCLMEDRCLFAEKELRAILNNKNGNNKNTAIAEFLYNEKFEALALKKLEEKEFFGYRDYYILLGKLYAEKGLYEKSAVAFNKSIELDPYNIEALSLLESTKNEKINKETLTEKRLKVIY